MLTCAIAFRSAPILAHARRMQLCAVTSASAPAQSGSSTARTKPSQGELVEAALRAAPAAAHAGLVDIGANLMDKSFERDRGAVLERAARESVAVIITGSCLRSTQAAAHFADTSDPSLPAVYFTAGVHPHNAKHCDDDTLPLLRRLAAHPRCVAVGECGLDFNRNFSPPDAQERWFQAQVALAQELCMPLFLHCRDAGPRFLDLLRAAHPAGGASGVLHCFTGSSEELQAALALGLHVGVTGWVCDERPERGGGALGDLLPLIPDDRLLLETDAPYLTPRTIAPSKARPSRNEPALLPFVLARVAEARGQSAEHVAAVSTANARRLFGLAA